jgi:hypothetical protein
MDRAAARAGLCACAGGAHEPGHAVCQHAAGVRHPHDTAGHHRCHAGVGAGRRPRRHAGRAARRPQRAAPGRLRDRAARRLAGPGRRPGRRPWPADLADFDCRNNRLAERGLQADGFAESVQRAVQRFGAARVGVFLGTSTSGILSTEVAYRHRDPATGALPASLHYATTHNTYSVARYVRQRLGLQGPAAVVSTACSSSAKVFGQAARLIELGLIDAAVVGGVDSLCLTTLYGFPRWNWCRPTSAGPGTRSARACPSARPPPLRCWNATPPAHGLAAGLRRKQRRPPHEQPAPRRRRRRAWPCARRWRRPAAADGSRLRQPARHRHAGQRRRRGPGVRRLRHRHALQQHQGLHRPHAGRGRRRGSGDQRCWRCSTA